MYVNVNSHNIQQQLSTKYINKNIYASIRKDLMYFAGERAVASSERLGPVAAAPAFKWGHY